MTASPQDVELDLPLSAKESQLLKKYEEVIREAAGEAREGFRKMAEAFHQIRAQRLYRGQGTFTEYFKKQFDYGRSHANRIADAGRLMELSPRGDILEKLESEAHFRPLGSLRDEPDKLEQVFDLLESWGKWRAQGDIPPAEVRSAKVFLNPPTEPAEPEGKRDELTGKFISLIEDAEGDLPSRTSDEIRQLFQQLKYKVTALGARRTSKIEWTQDTWNPLQGCTRASEGCDRCYAAKFVATRGKDMYPGLARKTGETYAFTGEILLLPERLGDPLLKRTPTRYFVNSMSDLFHKKVPEDFISAVFDVMEKAPWHTFQVLTKRPERMAAFTQKRYKDREPMENIWLGTSTENQESFDKRIEHLRQVKAAVRWLSCEPLLGPIRLSKTADIDWVVVGGESKGGRPMDKKWAASLRDQCKKAKIPFFFKQWGDFNEEGAPQKEKKDGGAKLDGKIHQEYPTPGE